MGGKIAIVGAGGLAREFCWLLRQSVLQHDPNSQFVGYLVSDLSKLGEHDGRDEVLGDLDCLETNPVDEVVIGIGDPRTRLTLGRELRQRFPKIRFPILLHPTTTYDRASTRLGDGAVVCANNVMTVNITIAEFAMINLSCTVGHEATIGAGSVLNPGVNVSGGVTLGEGVLVGTGAQILQYVTIGNGATIGAGAVVTKDVPAGAIAVGVPAKLR